MMTNKKSLRRALILNVLSTLLCVSMLLGTTFAWFTDTVESGINQIVAGNLDVELTYKDEGEFKPVTSTVTLFTDVTKWEPGAVAYEVLKVSNAGDLALKYALTFTAANATASEKDETKTLADVLKVAVVAEDITANATRETLLAAFTEDNSGYLANVTKENRLAAEANPDVYTVIIYWEPSDNDDLFNMNNDYNTAANKLTVDLGVKLFATQYTVEADSFNDQYDADAENPVVVATATAFSAALTDAEVENVVLSDDLSTSGPQVFSGKTIDGNGNTITISNTGSNCGLAAKSGTIENVTIIGSGRGIGTGSSGTYAMDGDLYIDHVTVNGPTYGINIGQGNGNKVVVTDSTIYGWNSMANVDASFTNCIFGKGDTNYAVFAIYTNSISFTNCNFGDTYAFYGRSSSAGAITLTNCVCRGENVTAANFATLFNDPQDSDFNYLLNQCEIYVDGVRVNP